jgi:hypothetical protein
MGKAMVFPENEQRERCERKMKIEYVCVRIKLHTCIDSVNTKTQRKS